MNQLTDLQSTFVFVTGLVAIVCVTVVTWAFFRGPTKD
jgi:hypothetical protein